MPETSTAIEVRAETGLPRRSRRRSDLNEGKGFLGRQDSYNINDVYGGFDLFSKFCLPKEHNSGKMNAISTCLCSIDVLKKYSYLDLSKLAFF